MIDYEVLRFSFFKSLNLHLSYLKDYNSFLKNYFGITLYENQQEIIESILDWNKKYILIMQARGAGKSFSVGLGLILLGFFYPGLQIGIVAPKEDQAVRLLKVMKGLLRKSMAYFRNMIDERNDSSVRLVLKNGTEYTALSAHEQTLQEGWHFSVMCIDEAMRVSDVSMNTRLLPMLGSTSKIKLIKIGIPVFKNHFYKSFISSQYTKCVRNWRQCPILLSGGYVVVDGEKISKYVLDRMPLSLKMKYWPNHPELHYEGDMSEYDFKIQYEVEWSDDLSLVLTGEDQEMLFGDFLPLDQGRTNEMYFFGLDTASGSLNKSNNVDFTSLSIWRYRNNVLEKVYCMDWQGDTLNQISEIKEILTNKFKCFFGYIDYSNIGVVVVEELKRVGVSCEGILFNSSFEGGKNFKNTVVPHFVLHLRGNRVKYPVKNVVMNHPIFRKHYNQWCIFERRKTNGLNDKLEAPEGEHDDGVMADLLAFWAWVVKKDLLRSPSVSKYKIPLPVKLWG
ncbi:MAG: DEAD/DEAH box helicase family protein [Nanopusillaceae archaeon]